MPASEEMSGCQPDDSPPPSTPVASEMVLSELRRVLDSKEFSRAESLGRLLRFVVEHALRGGEGPLKEYLLGVEVFGRGEGFDPKTDTIVRVQTRKLRAKLDQYYQTEGRDDRVVIQLPKGGYAPLFHKEESQPSAPSREAQVVARPNVRRALGGVVFVLLALAAGVAVRLYLSPGVSAPQLKAFPFTTFAGVESDPAVSPDGRQLAFAWNGETQENFDIYVRGIYSDVPLRLTTHPGEDRNPVWSPDGQRIAFIRRFRGEDSVFVAPALGGPARKLHTLTKPFWWCPQGVSCMSWSPNGEFLALIDKPSRDAPQSVFLMSLGDLSLRRLTFPSKANSSFGGDVSPSFSPDGRILAFVRWRSAGSDVYVTSVSGGEARRVTSDNATILSVDWMPDGRDLVFSSDRVDSGGIWTMPLSGGSPHLAVPATEIAILSVSRQTNRLAYTPCRSYGTRTSGELI